MEDQYEDTTIGIDYRGQALRSVAAFDVPATYRQDLQGILIASGEVTNRVERLAQYLDERFNPGLNGDQKNTVHKYRHQQFNPELNGDQKNTVHALVIMKGAFFFGASLLQQMKSPLELQTPDVDSGYDGGTKPVRPPVVSNLNISHLKGKDVMVVEDIIDTKHSYATLHPIIDSGKPRSITLVSLLCKPSRHDPELSHLGPDYVGFTIDDHFVIGHGLDWKLRYRNLAHISVLKNKLYNSP